MISVSTPPMSLGWRKKISVPCAPIRETLEGDALKRLAAQIAALRFFGGEGFPLVEFRIGHGQALEEKNPHPNPLPPAGEGASSPSPVLTGEGGTR